jgi:uncharacterized protein with HEPN domain
MRPDPRKYLWDALSTVELVHDFTQGQSFVDYLSNAMLRSAVERQFEIIEEALNQLSKVVVSTFQAPAIRLSGMYGLGDL